MNDFVRPEIMTTTVAVIFIFLITVLTARSIKSFVKKSESKYSSYLSGSTNLALILCAVFIGFIYTILAMYAVNQQMAKNEDIAYLNSSFLNLYIVGLFIGCYFLLRAFNLGIVLELTTLIIIFASGFAISRDYCYLKGIDLYISTPFRNSKISLTTDNIKKVIVFKKIAGRPKYTHIPIDDMVIYMKDGSRWTSAFYAADLSKRKKFNAELIAALPGIRPEEVPFLYADDIN